MNNTFSSYHPAVNMACFAMIMIFSMFLMHPACLAISVLGAGTYYIMLKGFKSAGKGIKAMIPLALFTALINPVFNHEGATILAYLPGGNPLTLESILVGAAAAFMLTAIIGWFACFAEVMGPDRFIYLFGRITPALALILSMALRFVPVFKTRLLAASQAQKCLGRDLSSGSLTARMRSGMGILSIMTTWALESSIDTADSMKSRGYGLPGRTSFSIFRFDRRDGLTLGFLAVASLYIIAAAASGALYCRYFPTFKAAPAGALQFSALAAYLALCCTPVAVNIREVIKWKAM